MKKIVFIFRIPTGGLFRHVYDAGIALAKKGYDIGIICSDDEVPPRWQNMLDELAQFSTLGVMRLKMDRNGSFNDVSCIREIAQYMRRVKPDVVHGHGAKGGLYARLSGLITGGGCARIYTSHGGSLHFPLNTLQGKIFANIELALLYCTDGIAFESNYIKNVYENKISVPTCPIRVIYNGLEPYEFDVIDQSAAQYDFLFMAEFVHRKGYDQFVQALSQLKEEGLNFKALCAGAGPDEDDFKHLIETNNLQDCVHITPPKVARDLFKVARLLVNPSRAESMPYAIIEAVAAQMPLISTNVGGIPEIIGNDQLGLFQAEDVNALTLHMRQFLKSPTIYEQAAKLNRHYVQSHFQINYMAEGLIKLYHSAIAKRRNLSIL